MFLADLKSLPSPKMLSLSTFTHLALGANLLAQVPLLNALALVQQRQTGTLDNFTATELPIALQGILNNIGPAGILVPGAAPGLVIASPTQNNPDCMYHHSTISSQVWVLCQILDTLYISMHHSSKKVQSSNAHQNHVFSSRLALFAVVVSLSKRMTDNLSRF